MSRIKYHVPVLIGFLILSSCSKEEDYNAEAQMVIDKKLIIEYLEKTSSMGLTADNSGIYYEVIKPGTGAIILENSTVQAAYEGKRLDGATFDRTSDAPVAISLGQMIRGWQIGVPKIREGGEIRLVIPSPLAYGNRSSGSSLPPNTILDYVIAITKVQ